MLEPLPENPVIGVYALTYNHEDFIAEAIESVLAQGWPGDRLRFILLDDGSTDRTPEIVKPYEQHLTYVRQENQGINAAVSRLVSLVDGDILLPLSGDDLWPADRIESVVEYFREHPEVGMVFGDMEAIDHRGRVFIPSVFGSEPPAQGQIAGALLKGNFVSGGSLAVRGALKPAMVPIPSDAAWEDWWFAWALTNVAPIGATDKIVYRYRKHRNNFVFGITERDTEASLDRFADELPFRRYLLGNARPGTCHPRELLEAIDELRRLLGIIVGWGRALETVLPVTEAQHAAADRLADTAETLTRSHPVLAVFAAARALAADPLHKRAYQALQLVAGSPKVAPAPLQDVGAVTVFAEAEELGAEPELLVTYVDAVHGFDDVTLVIAARGWDAAQLGAELGPLVERTPGAGALDILALPAGATSWMTALTQADAVLGLRALPIPGVPRFEQSEPLREHIALRRRLPLRRP